MAVDEAVAFIMAVALGFLVGRTRGDKEGERPAPGIRDFVISAAAGALCGQLGDAVVTLVTALGLVAVMVVLRLQAGLPRGLTTEFAAVLMFVIGYLCATPLRPLAAAAGIVLAMLLSRKETLHRFALRVISQKEFDDILSFLALIFIVYPLLPGGTYGPYQFFDPRKVWLFVILVCSVSFVGYFLVKFVGSRKGVWLTAVLGGLASTTAYTAAASKEAKESPDEGEAGSGVTLVANSIMFPRMAVILGAISPPLALASLPMLLVMMGAGLLSAFLICRKSFTTVGEGTRTRQLDNPFSIGPALKLGIMFTLVLFISKGARHWLGSGSEVLTAAVGGLLDVDAIVLSLGDSFNQQQIDRWWASLALLIAAAANGVFKIGLAVSSGVAAFYLRVIAGFLIMFGAGLAWLWLGK